MGNNKNNFKKPKKRANKINLVFDENKRREFLTGFHKRKLQRKKEAREKFEKELKEERKRIKVEAKESYKKLVLSHKPIPELVNLIHEEYDDEDVHVSVVELSTKEIALKNLWIGPNTPMQVLDEQNESDGETEHKDENEIPGMELKRKVVPVQKKTKEENKFETEKDVKKALKKQATKTVKKSKVFQMKNKLEQKKQKKKSLQQKKQKMKFNEMKGRHKKSGNRS